MPDSPFRSPVVVDGVLSEERLEEMLELGTEYPELDYKASAELDARGVVELAKDVGAMQVEGGYILIGVDGAGSLTGSMDDVDHRPWDEANLTPKLRRYLPSPLVLRSRPLRKDGHTVVALYVGPHPSGCALFKADGTFTQAGKEVVRFRAGDAFWRDGTRSVRLDQAGLERVHERRLLQAKTRWLDEQREIRSGELEELAKAYASRSVVNAPLGSVSFDLAADELSLAGVEMLRVHDEIALRHLLLGAPARAKRSIERDEIEAELGDLLDKLFCLAATFMIYDLDDAFESVLGTIERVVTLGFEARSSDDFDHATALPPAMKGPRVWFLILERAYALGALAVRREQWAAVRRVVLRRPKGLSDYYGRDWLMQAMTMASRAQHLEERSESGQTKEVSLLARALADTRHLACLNPNEAGDEDLLNSLVQFDFLVSMITVDDSKRLDRLRYPSFARFREDRVFPIMNALAKDPSLRETLLTSEDSFTAEALKTVGELAQRVGFRYSGFWGPSSAAMDFVQSNLEDASPN